MAKHFDPRMVFRQFFIPLLQYLFAALADSPDLPWDCLKETRQFELIYEAWRQLPEERRREIQSVFRDLVERGENRDVRAFVELLNANQPQHPVNIDAVPPENAFFRRGDFWVVAYADKTVYLRDSVGLSYLARLLAEPHCDIPAVSLLAARVGIDPRIASGSSGTILTDETRKDYMRRYQELQGDLHKAAEDNDLGCVEKLETEMEQLASELARATGLGGRRREKSDSERVRKSVSMAVSRGIDAIGKRHETLGRHLTAAVSSGLTFRYAPERDPSWLT